MSFDLSFVIFFGGLFVVLAWPIGLLMTKLRLSYYDNRLTEAQLTRMRRRLLAFYVVIWLIAIATILLRDYA